MLKPFQTNQVINAKATLAVAVCTLLALSSAIGRADNTVQSQNRDSSSSASTSRSGHGGAGTAGVDASSETGRSSHLSRSDQNFIKDAAKGGMMEVHMGKLGVQHAQNDQVKQYAQRLIDDHTKANAELKQLASQKGVTLPDDKVASDASSDTERSKVRDILSGDHKEHAAMKKLEGLSGTDFDREFVRMAVDDHEKDVKEFEKEAQKADDTDLKAWAQKTAPTLREHLQQAKTLQAQVGGTTSNSQK